MKAKRTRARRFRLFEKEVMPLLIGPAAQTRTVVFVPSYLDYVRLRNLLHRTMPEDYSAICEYTRDSEVSAMGTGGWYRSWSGCYRLW